MEIGKFLRKHPRAHFWYSFSRSDLVFTSTDAEVAAFIRLRFHNPHRWFGRPNRRPDLN